jgi:hypothetical protein
VNVPAAAVSALEFQLAAGYAAGEGELVAEVQIETSKGEKITRPLRYGLELRAPSDLRSTGAAYRENGISEVSLQLGGKAIKSLQIVPKSPYIGLTLTGIRVNYGSK